MFGDRNIFVLLLNTYSGSKDLSYDIGAFIKVFHLDLAHIVGDILSQGRTGHRGHGIEISYAEPCAAQRLAGFLIHFLDLDRGKWDILKGQHLIRAGGEIALLDAAALDAVAGRGFPLLLDTSHPELVMLNDAVCIDVILAEIVQFACEHVVARR